MFLVRCLLFTNIFQNRLQLHKGGVLIVVNILLEPFHDRTHLVGIAGVRLVLHVLLVCFFLFRFNNFNERLFDLTRVILLLFLLITADLLFFC